ncbi:MAG: protein kinase [Acidobacteria bacterium]|nr:protein kinase [Acidobacteriota bacterium]
MTLSTGTKLSHYEITSQIGKGGMGEVYQATDKKLGREVAIKVLPEEFAKDADRVARFQREAKLLASLNHPNIAAIYGLEESDGTNFLVMELVEGNTLDERIKAGAIPVEEALKLALQIAEALEAAHERGVIHRDLKPANIKVTPEGKVKVLDFGLAKAFAGEQEQKNLSKSPTLSVAATQQGVILGTAAYMSSEQAKGKSLDKRTDVWAFGCVLFEMLTGEAAFQGEDVTEILASVVKANVDLGVLPKNLHPRVREVIGRCLQKDLRRRYADIADVRYEIEEVLGDGGGVFVEEAVSAGEPRTRLWTMLPWLATAVALTAIVAGGIVWKLRTPDSGQVVRFDYDLPEDQRFTSPGRSLVAVSPDGTQIVYVANNQLFLKKLNESTAQPIQGTDENPAVPFFSPDGQWIGYLSQTDTQIKKILVGGGMPEPICDLTTNPNGVSWGVDDTIVFGHSDGIKGVSANGGAPELIAKIQQGENVYGPQVLPGGEWVLFTHTSASGTTRWDEAQIMAASLKTGERRIIIRGGSDARYVPTGHLVYALGNILYAVAFDVDSLEKKSERSRIIEGIRRPSALAVDPGTANYGFSDGGILAYIPGGIASSMQELVWVNRNGDEEPLDAPPHIYQQPRLSPDETQVAFTVEINGNIDIGIWDLIDQNFKRLTFHEAEDSFPLWSPDGKRIFFYSRREGLAGLYWKAADGTGVTEKLNSLLGEALFPVDWSKDGKTLILEVNTEGRDAVNISKLSMENDNEITPLLQGDEILANPQISPNGRWMAFFSRESGQREIYVHPYPELQEGGRWQISENGGQEPRWSPNGKEIFFRSVELMNVMMAIAVETEGTFRKTGVPQTLFQDFYYSGTGHNWDISSDGKRFLMLKPVTTDYEPRARVPRKINIVLNWFEELKDKVPVD